jgi:hypothetical protein
MIHVKISTFSTFEDLDNKLRLEQSNIQSSFVHRYNLNLLIKSLRRYLNVNQHVLKRLIAFKNKSSKVFIFLAVKSGLYRTLGF